MIPGLKKAEFVRYGRMHRNTFIYSPAVLFPTLQFRKRENVFFAGQITGVEGYIGNIATGLLAGINAAHSLLGLPLIQLPETTMLGALCHYICTASEHDFQPMKANFGLMPASDDIKAIRSKQERSRAYCERALITLDEYLAAQEIKIGKLCTPGVF